MELPNLVEMLKAGMHFGHQPTRRHPKMIPYIFGVKSGVSIINLEVTAEKLKPAIEYAEKLASENKILLFLGTKTQAQDIVAKYARECQMPYITERWLGGTVTNFAEIRKVIRKLRKLKEELSQGELKKYTKLEQLEFTREIEKLEKMVGGIQTIEKVPDAVYIVDIRKEKTAITECNKKKIPVIAICDSNVNPEKVTYPIPANDDATKSIELITKLISEAVSRGREKAKEINKVN